MIVVAMGVCGSGKTSVGIVIASRMNWPFIEGDDLHPPANKTTMASGAAATSLRGLTQTLSTGVLTANGSPLRSLTTPRCAAMFATRR